MARLIPGCKEIIMSCRSSCKWCEGLKYATRAPPHVCVNDSDHHAPRRRAPSQTIRWAAQRGDRCVLERSDCVTYQSVARQEVAAASEGQGREEGRRHEAAQS